MRDDDVVEVVDEIVDEMNPVRIGREAERLEIPIDTLIERIVNELKARLRD